MHGVCGERAQEICGIRIVYHLHGAECSRDGVHEGLNLVGSEDGVACLENVCDSLES